MSLPAQSLEQLLAFEENIEGLIVAYFTEYGLPNAGRTRSQLSFEAPFVGITFYNGEPIIENQKAILTGIPGAYLPWNSYTGRLLTTVATVRQDDPNGSVHTGLLGLVRKNLQLFRLIGRQEKYQQIDLIFDIREGGSIGNFDDEKGIDYTEITWNVRHTLNTAAWPSNPDL